MNRTDGKYVYRKRLAVLLTQRLAEVQAKAPAERSEDEQLILFMAGEIKDLARQVNRMLARREAETQESTTLLGDAYAELVERHQGVLDALRVHGYQGSDLAAEVSGWLMRT